MKRVNVTLFVILLFLLTGCSTTKTIKFSQQKNEVFTNSSLSEFIKNHKEPKIVLRIKNNSSHERTSVTFNEGVEYFYQAIENTLLANNFIVRDRQLFNRAANNENHYKSIAEKMDTELILELTKLDPAIKYKTNKYYDSKNKEKIDKDYSYRYYGASVEFKLILLKDNEFAGSYKFNYTPCTSGCTISVSRKDRKRQKELEKRHRVSYEEIERDALIEFIKDATQKLVDEIRK